jgi:endogenous inhibitor of DNA gyrase (YacG/DUF329 family)
MATLTLTLTTCPTCNTEVEPARNSLTEPITVERIGLILVPEVHDGETVLCTRLGYREHRCGGES